MHLLKSWFISVASAAHSWTAKHLIFFIVDFTRMHLGSSLSRNGFLTDYCLNIPAIKDRELCFISDFLLWSMCPAFDQLIGGGGGGAHVTCTATLSLYAHSYALTYPPINWTGVRNNSVNQILSLNYSCDITEVVPVDSSGLKFFFLPTAQSCNLAWQMEVL